MHNVCTFKLEVQYTFLRRYTKDRQQVNLVYKFIRTFVYTRFGLFNCMGSPKMHLTLSIFNQISQTIQVPKQ